MITDSRLKHMLGVARVCYEIAQKQNRPEEECRLLFLMGFIHDMGYEFIDETLYEPGLHQKICADMLHEILFNEFDALKADNIMEAIKYHGTARDTGRMLAKEYGEILNYADFTVDGEGKRCSLKERKRDILLRYCNDEAAGEILHSFDEVVDFYDLESFDESVSDIKRDI